MSNHPEQAHDTIRPYRSAHTKIVLEGGGQLRYWPCFFEPLLAETLYDWLRRDVPWQQMKFRGHFEPRLTAWMGEFPYRYSGVTRSAAPFIPIVEALVVLVEKSLDRHRPGMHFSGALLNYYRSGLDKIGLHSDAEPDLLPGAPIASLSFGATRRFVLRHNRSSEKHVLSLSSGSLLVMEGETQAHWKHEIPAGPRVAGGRINITLRCRTAESTR